MKKIFAILLVNLALVVVHTRTVAASPPLSQLAGSYSVVAQGSDSICFNSTFTDVEDCLSPSPDTYVAQGNFQLAGQVTFDENGNSCQTLTQTFGYLYSPFPPSATVYTVSGQLIDYNSSTGTGDGSFMTYTGGSCSGSKFKSAGATLQGSGTTHFVVSNGNNRIDFVVTTNQGSPTAYIGSFNSAGFNLRQ